MEQQISLGHGRKDRCERTRDLHRACGASLGDALGNVELPKVRQRAHLISESHHGKRGIESEASAVRRIFGAIRNLSHARGRSDKGTLPKLAERPLEHRPQLQRRVILHIRQRRGTLSGRNGFSVVSRKAGMVTLKDVELSEPPYVSQPFSQCLSLVQPRPQMRNAPQMEQWSA